MKANAAKPSQTKVLAEREAAEFFERLDKYEAEERERLALPQIERKPRTPKISEQIQSITDPEAGWLCRPGKPGGFHYLAHQTVDAENGIIVDVVATPGNTSDSTPYLEQIERAIDTLEKMDVEVETVCADSAYDNAIIHKELEDHELAVYMPEKATGGNSKTEFTRENFTFDPEKNQFIRIPS